MYGVLNFLCCDISNNTYRNMYPNIRCLHKNGGDSTVAEKKKRGATKKTQQQKKNRSMVSKISASQAVSNKKLSHTYIYDLLFDIHIQHKRQRVFDDVLLFYRDDAIHRNMYCKTFHRTVGTILIKFDRNSFDCRERERKENNM